MDHFIYLGASIERREIWKLQHEGDYQEGDLVVRVAISDHESVTVDIKPTGE